MGCPACVKILIDFSTAHCQGQWRRGSMKTSKVFIGTQKEVPADAEIVSHRLMLRASLIRRLAAGVYTWLPLGLRAMRKVEAIVREEMIRAGAIELLMPVVQPGELWQESGRWREYGPELLRFRDRHERDFVIQPTSEEVITDHARSELKSYRRLPLHFFHIQTKFRDERRPRFGVMRSREFVMKDGYSFHADYADLEREYRNMHDTYTRIFTRLGLKFRAVAADTGAIGGTGSHEFHVLADSGEDAIAFSPQSSYAANVELAEAVSRGERAPAKEAMKKVPTPGNPSPDGNGQLEIVRGIEVGHIFQLRTKYSEAMGATFLDASGAEKPFEMGCYGIGVTRIVAAAIEQNYDPRGILFPAPIAPFGVCLVPIGYQKSTAVREATDRLYQELVDAGVDVLLDDREERPGVLFADMDLIGIAHRIVLGERGLAAGNAEYKARRDEKGTDVPLASVAAFLRERL